MSFRSDFYNGFFTPPDALITGQVLEWLTASGLFQQVVDFTSPVDPTHILEGELTDLYGDFSEGSQPRAALGIRVALMEDVSGRPKILFQKRYRKETPLKVDSPEALVQGWNKALRQILTDFEGDLREVDLKAG